ncbi:MAG: hypothetical protein WD046_02285 [Paracoccaceae bacterium]
MIRRAFALILAFGVAPPALAANPQLRSDMVEGVQPLLAMGANLCVGAMRMGNALPLRVLDHLGESPSLGMENRLYSDQDRIVDVILAGTSPGQREVPPVFCLTQPRQPMAADDKAALRDWVVDEFARMAAVEGVTAVDLPDAQFFGRMVFWCDSRGEHLVFAASQARHDAELRIGVARNLPDGSAPDCAGATE